MGTDLSNVQAISFDYGNTLAAFTMTQLKRNDQAMIDFLTERCGPLDADRYRALRHADRLAPYQDDYRENVVPELLTNHIRQLYGCEPAPDLLDEMAAVRFEAFVASVDIMDDTIAALEVLRGRFRLAVLSNYPEAHAIRASMDRLALTGYFDVILTSGDVGRVKPHPAVFDAVTRALDVPAEHTLHVGDNWLADIQGAKRNGLLACHLTQYAPPERFEPQDGDALPDLVIDRLRELPPALGIG
jgi:HAD superfamily hydrolase (TIGR01549 family)